MNESDGYKWGTYGYRPSDKNETVVIFKDFKPMNEIYEEDKLSPLIGFTFDKILRNDYHNQMKVLERIDAPKLDEYCIVRNWVYNILKDDMSDILKEKED